MEALTAELAWAHVKEKEQELHKHEIKVIQTNERLRKLEEEVEQSQVYFSQLLVL